MLMEHGSWRSDELRLTEMLANPNPCDSEATVPSGGHIQLMLFVQFSCSRSTWKDRHQHRATNTRSTIKLIYLPFDIAL